MGPENKNQLTMAVLPPYGTHHPHFGSVWFGKRVICLYDVNESLWLPAARTTRPFLCGAPSNVHQVA